MQVLLLVHPVAQRDDDVAFDALRPRRLGKRQFTLRNPLGPVAVVRKGHLAKPGQLRQHHRAGLARLHPAAPRVGVRGECAKRWRDGARRELSELMATDAAGVLDRAQPGCLVQPRGNVATTAELIGGRNLQHRVPVDRRVVVRRRRFIGRRHRRDAQLLARLRRRLRAVDQAVTARPHRVARRRQVRHDESPLVVGDDALDIADRQIARLRDHPDARLGAARPGDGAADVVAIDGDGRRLLRQGGCLCLLPPEGGEDDDDREGCKKGAVLHDVVAPMTGRGAGAMLPRPGAERAPRRNLYRLGAGAAASRGSDRPRAAEHSSAPTKIHNATWCRASTSAPPANA